MPTLTDRQSVDGTTPTIYIGHRVDRAKDGRLKSSKTWWAEFCIDSKQRYESLKTTNLKVAIRAAHDLMTRLESNEPAAAKRKIDFADLVRRYMELQTNKGQAPKTIEKYQYVLDTFAAWTNDEKIASANQFTTHHFWAYNKHLKDLKLAAPTCYDRMIIVKQLFKWAAKSKLLPSNMLEGETLSEPQSKLQPCFSPDQVGTMLDEADPHEAAIYSVMAFAGLRFGEVQQLKWQDLILPAEGGGFIVVQRGGSGETTKGKRTRKIPIHPELRIVLDKLPRAFGTVFTARPSKKHPKGGGLISGRRLLVGLKRLCHRCEFPDADQFKVHTLRHAFASMLARNNVSYKYALEFMGHKSSDILDLYYSMFDDVAHQAIKTIDYPRKGAASAPAA